MQTAVRLSHEPDREVLSAKRSRLEASSSTCSPPQLIINDSNPLKQIDAVPINTVVCFGMLADCPIIDPTNSTLLTTTAVTPVVLQGTIHLQDAVTRAFIGQPDEHTSQILSRLLAEDDFVCEFTARKETVVPTPGQTPARGSVGYLSTIIYGPRGGLEDMGNFMTQCGRYLEIPVGCTLNVPYMNAQCLSSLYEAPIMTFDIPTAFHGPLEDFDQACADILAAFETSNFLRETPTPELLSSQLKPHQKQALTFFRRREQGLHPSQDSIGLWVPDTDKTGSVPLSGQAMDMSTRPSCSYTNMVTNRVQSDIGPLCRGGILADEMGLGKTLSMIALIASDYAQSASNLTSVSRQAPEDLESTLVILPLSLIPVWLSQLESHVHPGRLTHMVHHGNSRLRLPANATPPNIVFTTYQTIEYEQRRVQPLSGALCKYSWRRIILDEAHIIRTHGNATARAVTALRARARWAISGTPVQNKLTDFLGYFKFLQFSPYSDTRVFDQELSQVWRERPEDEAIEIFKKVLACVMLRRSKGVLDLPARRDNIVHVDFSVEEEKHYRRAEQPATDILDQLSGDSLPTAIQQINKLRIICNLGVHIPQQPNLNSSAPKSGSAPAMMIARLSMGEDACAQCLGSVSLPSIDEGLGKPKSSNTYYSTCGQLYCASCSRFPCPCGCVGGSCRLLPLSSSCTPRLTPVRDCSPDPDQGSDDITISSKVRALVNQIRSRPDEKHVVFSFWTTSLDMVERRLAAAEIGFVRIDSSVAPSDRAQAIQQLRDDPLVRSIILTIGCGACGLDLTAASTVHMLEPQWNPAVEDQAFARSHRLGQQRPVTTIKYVMKGSIEEDILEVLAEKRLLATSLLSDRAATKSLQDLLRERRRQRNGTGQ